MFDIESIQLSDFKSWKGEHKFEFPAKYGLYFLTGENRVEPKLGSNGAGKSTLLDAIYWCYFGKTPRGLRAGDIINRGAKTCSVTVTQTVGDRKFSVKRTQSPNSLKIVIGKESLIVEQDGLEKQLCLNAETFLYTILTAQFGQSFFDLKPEAKLTLFSQVMGLDYWLEKSNEANEEAKSYTSDISNTESNIATIKAMQISGKENLEMLVLKSNDFDLERNTQLISHKRDLENAERLEKTILKNVTQIETNLTATVADLGKLRTDSDWLESEYLKVMKKYNEVVIAQAALVSKDKQFKKELSSFEGIAATCPTCKQVVSPKHIRSEREKVTKQISDLEIEVDKHNKWSSSVSDESSEVEAERTKIKREIAELEKEICSLRISLKDEERKLTNVKSNISRVETEIKQVKANPYIALIKKQETDLLQLVEKLVATQTKLHLLNEEYEAIKYWVSGFKKLRLFLIEETLRGLEMEVNNNLISLGLLDWEIGFDVERENKSGGITKGFSVFIKGPKHNEPVKWESFSGGEIQRLRMAGDLGLSNLIMAQSGLIGKIEFYDEPSTHLSQEGLLDLAETLQQRATTTQKRIFMVDHNLPDFGDFTDTFTVVKDENGSHID